MRVQIRAQHLKMGDEARASIERRLQFALATFATRLGGVTVYLSDLNGPRGGVDKRCRIVVRMGRAGELVTEDTDASLVAAVDRAAERVERAVRREINRRRERKNHGEKGENGVEDAKGEVTRTVSHARVESEDR